VIQVTTRLVKEVVLCHETLQPDDTHEERDLRCENRPFNRPVHRYKGLEMTSIPLESSVTLSGTLPPPLVSVKSLGQGMLKRVQQMGEVVENHGTGDGGWNVGPLFLSH
jgi:hypothetical protein